MPRSQARPSDSTSRWIGLARLAVFLAAGLSVSGCYGQTLIPELKSGGAMRIRQTDLAVLERQESRSDLQCTVSRIKPELDWDFTFRTGYQVNVQMADLVGNGNQLTVLFRVVPQDHPNDPAYMVQRIRVPAIEEGSKGESTFYGKYKLGEGKYHIDWLMRDQQEHTCAMSWDVETKLNSKDSPLRQWTPQALVQPLRPPFTEESPVIPAPESGLPRVNIIMNFDPPDSSGARLDEHDLESLVAILCRIVGDPRIETHSILAFSLQTQQVIYHQEDASSIHLAALGEAVKSLKFGVVDAKQLTSANGPAQFATDLFREHLRDEDPDALIVLGRKAGWEKGVSREALGSFDKPGAPAFYLSYNAEQQPILSRDPISSIIKRLRGFEYAIRRPKDLFNAWSDVIARIVRTKQVAQPSTSSNSKR
jgi:hypothetical protein